MRINTFNFPDTFSNDGRVKMKEGPSAINQNLGLMIKCQRPQLLQNTDYGTILRKQKFKQKWQVVLVAFKGQYSYAKLVQEQRQCCRTVVQ